MGREKKHETAGWGGGDHREENKVADSRSNPGCLRIFVLPHMIAGAFIFYLCVMMVEHDAIPEERKDNQKPFEVLVAWIVYEGALLGRE